MNMRIRGSVVVAALALAFLLAAPPAYADFELRLATGANFVNLNSSTGCTDSAAGAICAGATTASTGVGTATYVGPLGAFTLNSTTGVTKPTTVPPVLMDTVTLNILSAGAATMTITWSDQGWTDLLGFVLNAGGTLSAPAGSSVLYETFLNNANVLSAQTVLVGALGPFGPGAFAGSVSPAVVASATPYSLTQKLTIVFTGPGLVSGDFELQQVPEPAGVALLGGVLLVTFGALRRKFRRG